MIKVFSPITGETYEASGDRQRWSPNVTKLREAIESRFSIRYVPIVLASSLAIECTIADRKSGRIVTRLVESSLIKDDGNRPISRLYNAALLTTATAFLKLVPVENSKLEDGEILLFGALKGKKFGDVKGEAEFAHFLEQIKAARGLSFPDEKRQEQLNKLLVAEV